MDIKEIIRLAFLKYRLSGKKSMNTFIFSQVKKNNLSDEQIDEILNKLDNKIKRLEEEKKQQYEKEMQEEIEKALFKKVV